MPDASFTAHVDTFARDQLPPVGLWPALDLSALPDLARRARLNAATELLDATIERGMGERVAIRFPAARARRGTRGRDPRRVRAASGRGVAVS